MLHNKRRMIYVLIQNRWPDILLYQIILVSSIAVDIIHDLIHKAWNQCEQKSIHINNCYFMQQCEYFIS